ncbi:MAG: hypothetical protein P8J50_04505 [Acidimicrobiales bacterium]|jgi:hypothetical protein|nr:hypothetical protein [Acidimicrobiales bacterium]
MIEAGAEVLAERGVEMQISSVSYAKVFAHLERTKGVRVTYGSVHERIWDSLQEYQLSVIERAGLWDGTDSTDAFGRAAVESFSQADLSSREGRSRAAMDACRVLGGEYLNETNETDGWGKWLKSVVTMSTQPEDSPVRAAARQGAGDSYARLHDASVDGFRAACDATQFIAREFVPDGLDPYDTLTRMTVAVGDGLDFRNLITEQDEPTFVLNTGPDNAADERTF